MSLECSSITVISYTHMHITFVCIYLHKLATCIETICLAIIYH